MLPISGGVSLATVPLDIPTNVLLGALVALAGRRRLLAGPADAGPLDAGLTRAAGLLSLWFAACVTWFYVAEPDWMYMYFLDPSAEVPIGVGLPLFWVGLLGAGLVGAVATQALLSTGRTLAAWGVAGYGLVGWLGILFLTWDRYFHVGTTAEYRAGQAAPLAEATGFQTAMNVSGALIGLGVLAVLGWAWRSGRRNDGDANEATDTEDAP